MVKPQEEPVAEIAKLEEPASVEVVKPQEEPVVEIAKLEEPASVERITTAAAVPAKIEIKAEEPKVVPI